MMSSTGDKVSEEQTCCATESQRSLDLHQERNDSSCPVLDQTSVSPNIASDQCSDSLTRHCRPQITQHRSSRNKASPKTRVYHYQVNPPSSLFADTFGQLPRELSTSTTSSSCSSSSSSSGQSLELAESLWTPLIDPQTQRPSTLHLNSDSLSVTSVHQSTAANQTSARNSSTFWDLITDVAKDLDLTLQDISPDSEIFDQPSRKTKKADSQQVTATSKIPIVVGAIVKQCPTVPTNRRPSAEFELFSGGHVGDICPAGPVHHFQRIQSPPTPPATIASASSSAPIVDANVDGQHRSILDPAPLPTGASKAHQNSHQPPPDAHATTSDHHNPPGGHCRQSKGTSLGLGQNGPKQWSGEKDVSVVRQRRPGHNKTNPHRSQVSPNHLQLKIFSSRIDSLSTTPTASDDDAGGLKYSRPNRPSPKTNHGTPASVVKVSRIPKVASLRSNRTSQRLGNNSKSSDSNDKSHSKTVSFSGLSSRTRRGRSTRIVSEQSSLESKQARFSHIPRRADLTKVEKALQTGSSTSGSSSRLAHELDSGTQQSLAPLTSSVQFTSSSFPCSTTNTNFRLTNTTVCVNSLSSGTSTVVCINSDERKVTPMKILRPAPPVPNAQACSRVTKLAELDELDEDLPEGNVDDENQSNEDLDDDDDADDEHSIDLLDSTRIVLSVPDNSATNKHNGVHPPKLQIKVPGKEFGRVASLDNEDSEDSAADVSYERTSDNDSDLEDSLLTAQSNGSKDPNLSQRFCLTQSIWYLPYINRATVVHYLQGKTVGVFIVRQSSKVNTMALSVRLPHGRGPHVEHYLIERRPQSSSSKPSFLFRLEGSEHYFGSMQSLVLHYSACCDELPVQLSLSPVLLTANFGELVSLSLLGQEFWQSKFVSLTHLPKNALKTETLALVTNDNKLNEDPLEISEKPTKVTSVHSFVSKSPANGDDSHCQALRRHNSNSSESNTSKSSLSSPMLLSKKQANCKQRTVSPRNGTSRREPPSTAPPPLPPKSELILCQLGTADHPTPLIDTKKSSSVTITAGEQRHSPNSGNAGEGTPKLPPRRNVLPPPIPPRTRGSPGSTPPPPPTAALPPRPKTAKSTSMTTVSSSKQTTNSPNITDLLSPMSMTESEIELVKFSLNQNLLTESVIHDELGDSSIDDALVSARSNYYNHLASESKCKEDTSPQSEKAMNTTSELSVGDVHVLTKSKVSNEKAASMTATNTDDKRVQDKQPTITPADCHQKRSNSQLSLSSFYMDPIDALVTMNSIREPYQQKRHSDPELSSAKSHNNKNGIKVELTDSLKSSKLNSTNCSTLGHSLESLLENFKSKFPSVVDTLENGAGARSKRNRHRGSNIKPNEESVEAISIEGHIEEQVKIDEARAAIGEPRSISRPDAGFSTIDSTWQWLDCSNGGRSASISSNGAESLPSTNNAASFVGDDSRRSSLANCSVKSDSTTVEDLISAQAPEFSVPRVTHMDIHQREINNNNHSNVSVLRSEAKKGVVKPDNTRLGEQTDQCSVKSHKSRCTDSGTEFSDPWSLDVVESMFFSELGPQLDNEQGLDSSMRQLLNNDLINFNSFLLNQESQSSVDSNADYDNVADDLDYEQDDEIYGEYGDYSGNHNRMKRDDSEATLKDHETGAAQTNHQQLSDQDGSDGIMLNIAYNISNYVFELASRKDNTFAKSIDNFIECTKESAEANPSVILGYIRQFMNGMKNYLIKHGEGQFIEIVQRERGRLKSNQFLNIDSILEVALQKLIIKPLKNFIYELFVRHHTESGSLKILSTNIKLAQNKTPQELGIREELLPFDSSVMVEIQQNVRRLQQSYSPIKKLEYLLRCISIHSETCHHRMVKKARSVTTTTAVAVAGKSPNLSMSGDDMLPILVFLIVHCGMISAEIEVEYMLGLLHSSILNGEGSFYLTMLSSAIQALKSMYTVDSSRQLDDIITVTASRSGQGSFSVSGQQSEVTGHESMVSSTSVPSSRLHFSSTYMKVMIPNELKSSIACKTIPVRMNMTTKEVCRMIAHTYRITNPEDYALYRIKDNGLEEVQLMDNEYPQVVKSELLARNETPMFAYKRCDAKFIWPITSPL